MYLFPYEDGGNMIALCLFIVGAVIVVVVIFDSYEPHFGSIWSGNNVCTANILTKQTNKQSIGIDFVAVRLLFCSSYFYTFTI